MRNKDDLRFENSIVDEFRQTTGVSFISTAASRMSQILALQLPVTILRCFVEFQWLHVIREYFLRRTRDEFRENRNVKDPSKVNALLQRGRENLEVIRRQVSQRCCYDQAGTFHLSLGDHWQLVYAWATFDYRSATINACNFWITIIRSIDLLLLQ